MKFRALFLGLFLLGVLGRPYLQSSPEVSVFQEEEYVQVEGSKLYLEYVISPVIISVSGRVVRYSSAGGSSRDLGAAYELGIISESDYEEFRRLTDEGRCPANFLNARADTFLVIPASSSVQSTLPSRLQTGENISFEGSMLSVDYVEHKGQVLESFNISGISPFLLNSLSIE